MIEVKNLTHTYSQGTPFEHTAVKDMSFTVKQGEFLGIIGHTGSGKSTLMQHLNGLLKPSQGDILLKGESIWKDKHTTRAARFRVGLVFQYPEYQLFEETVYKDIAFGPKNMGLKEEEIRQRVHRAAAFVGLSESVLQKSPFELSGGQKRRVAIAGVIAMEPEVLILDEPTAGLDPKGREEILDQIQALRKETGMTIILVSHSMEDVARYVERIIVMNSGEVFMDGTPKMVFERSKDLESVGLAAPQVTYVMRSLQEIMPDLVSKATTVEEAKNDILRYMEARR